MSLSEIEKSVIKTLFSINPNDKVAVVKEVLTTQYSQFLQEQSILDDMLFWRRLNEHFANRQQEIEEFAQELRGNSEVDIEQIDYIETFAQNIEAIELAEMQENLEYYSKKSLELSSGIQDNYKKFVSTHNTFAEKINRLLENSSGDDLASRVIQQLSKLSEMANIICGAQQLLPEIEPPHSLEQARDTHIKLTHMSEVMNKIVDAQSKMYTSDELSVLDTSILEDIEQQFAGIEINSEVELLRAMDEIPEHDIKESSTLNAEAAKNINASQQTKNQQSNCGQAFASIKATPESAPSQGNQHKGSTYSPAPHSPGE